MKTFKEIAINELLSARIKKPEDDPIMKGMIVLMVNCMRTVRNATLKECAEKATLTQDEIMINSLDLYALDQIE